MYPPKYCSKPPPPHTYTERFIEHWRCYELDGHAGECRYRNVTEVLWTARPQEDLWIR